MLASSVCRRLFARNHGPRSATRRMVLFSSSASTIANNNINGIQQQQNVKIHHRFFSAGSSSSNQHNDEQPEATFSIYEYPTRTEAPIITTTNANDIIIEDVDSLQKPETTATDYDPFDDLGSLSKAERDDIKQSQDTIMSNLPLSSVPITTDVPDFVPPNVPSEQLTVPETLITTLPNGIRVVSQETYGQMCTMGVLTNVGSRHEGKQTGMVHLLETMAFGSTSKFNGLEIAELLQDWGATRFVSHSREQTLHCIDILRPNVTKGMELLADVVLNPIVSANEEFYNAKAVLEFQAQEQMPELVLGEAVQVAAYGEDQQLGQLHFAVPESIDLLTPPAVQDFLSKNIYQNPEGIVIAGAGISHDVLVDLTKEYFGHLQQTSAPVTIPSEYRGGSHLIENDPNKQSVYTIPEDLQYCRVALAFPVGGWHDDSMVTACVLQTLLGGGSSFSAGGPGKGMYSRMYQQVLNRYGWMETAEAFTTFAEEGGLFGVSASTPTPQKVGELVTILADQLARLAIQPVNEIELSRARNMLKCNVLAQLESRLILFEDMGRQVLTYGKRESASQTCKKIDAVTAEDIQKLAHDMLLTTPTLAATGIHLEQVPSHEQVSRWFQ